MIKNLLRLLASSATFIAVMLAANIAIAQPESAIAIPQVDNVSQSASSSVNLNVISSSLESYQSNNVLLDHLGCSCATCTQGA